MNTTLDRILLWSPRILGILYIAFTILLPLETLVLGVFAEYHGWEALLHLLIHLRWSIILLIALILAWRWEWVGILGFLAFGVWGLTAMQGFGSGEILVRAGVPILVGVLFLVGWFYRKKTQT